MVNEDQNKISQTATTESQKPGDSSPIEIQNSKTPGPGQIERIICESWQGKIVLDPELRQLKNDRV